MKRLERNSNNGFKLDVLRISVHTLECKVMHRRDYTATFSVNPVNLLRLLGDPNELAIKEKPLNWCDRSLSNMSARTNQINQSDKKQTWKLQKKREASALSAVLCGRA